MPGDCAEIRRLTGICPQQNVLFPSLTVKEHLNFFGTVKGDPLHFSPHIYPFYDQLALVCTFSVTPLHSSPYIPH